MAKPTQVIALATISLIGCSESKEEIPSSLGSVEASISEADQDRLYDELLNEHQEAVHAWGAEVEAARGTPDFEKIIRRGAQIDLHFLERFRALADKGNGQAKVEVLDLLAHIDPLPFEETDYTLKLLSEISEQHKDAWWISNFADDDIIRFFLLSPEKERAIELFEGLVEETSDEEAKRMFLLELAEGLIRSGNGQSDPEKATQMLKRITEEWPDSSEASRAMPQIFRQENLIEGRVMPDFSGSDIDGNLISLGDFKGKVLLVDFFGFWCGPCVKAIPELRELKREFGDKEFQILGISVKDSEETVRSKGDQYGMDWPCIAEGENPKISKGFGINTFPTVFLIDRQGIIRAVNPELESLSSVVQELLQDN